MEMDNDIKGTGNHLSTHFRGLDPRVVRWWSPDPAEKSYPGRSSYVSMGNNPVNNLDPNGDAETKTNVGVQIEMGSNTSVSAVVNFALYENINDFMPSLNINARYYTGGLGTNQGVTGSNSSNLDVTISLGVTVGSGNAPSMDLTTFNSMSGSAVPNTYNQSLTYASNFVLNSDGRNQLVHGLNFRTSADLSFTIYNDFDGIRGKDEYWTGGGFFNANIGGGYSLSGGTEVFTGLRSVDSKGDFDKSSIGRNGIYNQTLYQQSLNNGQTFLNIVTPGGVSAGLRMSGNMFGIDPGYSQHFIHNYVTNSSLFDYSLPQGMFQGIGGKK
jgi:RHS repeat-associated protein